ncbi:MAG: hypothetical protein WCA04_03065 [Geobacteraceae bacterium]
MKKTAVRLASISLFLLFTATLVHAAEQKILFNAESVKFESGTGSERCRDKCNRKSGPDAKLFLSEGWKIVSSSPKEVTGEQYWYVPCNTCRPHGCICIGTEYILQKDEPDPKIETKSNVFDTPGKDNRTVLQPVKVVTSENALDLLKKENDLLKQENALLKQENETLRSQLKSIQK